MAYSTATVGTAGRGTSSSQAVSLTSVPSGALVIVCAAFWNNTNPNGSGYPSTLTDSAGNTMTLRGGAPANVSGVLIGQFEGVMASAVGSWSLTVTQTGGSGTMQWDVVPMYYTANPSSGEFSQGGNASNSGSVTTLTASTGSATGTATELGVANFSSAAGSTTVYSSATLTTGWTWIYRNNDNTTSQAQGVAEGIQGTSGLNLHSTTVSVAASNITSGGQNAVLDTYNLDTGVPKSDSDSATASESPAITGNSILVPISDVSTGTWTPSSGSTLAPMLSEQPSPDDTTYDTSATTGGPDVMEVQLTSTSTPNAGPITVSYRVRSG